MRATRLADQRCRGVELGRRCQRWRTGWESRSPTVMEHHLVHPSVLAVVALCTFVPVVASAQQFFTPGAEANGQVSVQVNATLNDGIGEYQPVVGLTLTLYRGATDSMNLRTVQLRMGIRNLTVANAVVGAPPLAEAPRRGEPVEHVASGPVRSLEQKDGATERGSALPRRRVPVHRSRPRLARRRSRHTFASRRRDRSSVSAPCSPVTLSTRRLMPRGSRDQVLHRTSQPRFLQDLLRLVRPSTVGAVRRGNCSGCFHERGLRSLRRRPRRNPELDAALTRRRQHPSVRKAEAPITSSLPSI